MDHREHAVAHAGGRIARMQQVADALLGGIVAVEERVTGEHAIDEQQALEIGAHRRRLRFEARRVPGLAGDDAAREPASRASGDAASRSRRCTCDRASTGRPAAAHRSSRRGHTRRARSLRRRDARSAPARASRAATRSAARRACSARRWKNGTRSSSSAASPEAIRYCASASSGQNTMSPCESPARIVRSRSKNMNHCGQSPLGSCARITRSSRSRTGAVWPNASSSSSGPWQTSRVPHPPPEYCSSPLGER